MINLIPNKEQKEMARGFYFRLLILFLIVLSASFLIFFVAILPSYFLSSVKNRIVDGKLEIQKGEPVPVLDQETLAMIEALDAKLDLLEKAAENKFIVSQRVINAVILRKLPDIQITNISYEINSSATKGKRIGIQGMAPSREVLLSFRMALENDTLFEAVDLPISNFIKGSDIQFYLSLIPRSEDGALEQAI